MAWRPPTISAAADLLRPPLAHDRLRLRNDGRALVELKTVWRDGPSHFLFEPIGRPFSGSAKMG